MWTSRLLTLGLSLTLLLSTAGLVAHDHGVGHGVGTSQAELECGADHHGDRASARPGEQSEIHRGAKLHRHQCVACHLSQHRPLMASYREIESDLTTAGQRVLRPSGAPRVLQPSYIYSLRGPPIV